MCAHMRTANQHPGMQTGRHCWCTHADATGQAAYTPSLLHHNCSNDDGTVQLMISWTCSKHPTVRHICWVYKTDLLLTQLLLHIGHLLSQSINLNLQQVLLQGKLICILYSPGLYIIHKASSGSNQKVYDMHACLLVTHKRQQTLAHSSRSLKPATLDEMANCLDAAIFAS